VNHVNTPKLAMTPKASSDSGSPSETRSGFQAQIKGASLGDLVQMECLAGSHRAVKVTSANNVGYLYFRGGAVVHAAARALVGEAAALEVLSWNDGSFEAVEREWPTKESVSCSWQSLLLRAAQARDERSVPSVVALRPDPRAARPKAAALPVPESVEFQATPIEIAGHVLRGEDFQVLLRLDADGALVANRGGSQDFADIVAYACRLTELIGTHLGAERFMAMECSFKSGKCFIVLEANGDVVALRPHAASDSAALRNLLGL
jgi:hypothetical protein